MQNFPLRNTRFKTPLEQPKSANKITWLNPDAKINRAAIESVRLHFGDRQSQDLVDRARSNDELHQKLERIKVARQNKQAIIHFLIGLVLLSLLLLVII